MFKLLLDVVVVEVSYSIISYKIPLLNFREIPDFCNRYKYKYFFKSITFIILKINLVD